jgi:2-polyprenyl-6-methoxyphenol hydroxylase-like FAD-dependent oxidoreductase
LSTNTAATGPARPASASAALSCRRRSLVNQCSAAATTSREQTLRDELVQGMCAEATLLAGSRISSAMPHVEPIPSAPAVVLGGGIAGLAAARLLTRHFPRVIVLERDVRSDEDAPEAAFRSWRRGGVPQLRHSHAFLARVRLVLLAHLPDVFDRLRANGVREIPLADMAPPEMGFEPEPADEDVVLLACRRTTFEWALRAGVQGRRGVELREGVSVTGLAGGARNGGRPWVRGVTLADGSELPAALVVDALGRRSPVPGWLAALGAPRPHERSEDTGIFYYTRFYRLRRGQAPGGTTGVVASDLGWVKIAVFPGDAGTFSITVGAPVDDASLKELADPRQFERFVTAFPQIAPWRARGVSVPIGGRQTPVLVMGQLRNRLRHFVDDDGPVAPGLLVLGDAAYHSNPIYGRGCSQALVQAALLDEAVGRHPRDLVAAARLLHQLSEQQVRPFWDAAVAADRRSRGEVRHDPPATALAYLSVMAQYAFGWFLERGMLPATREDPVVFRGLLRVFHMLQAPDTLARDPELVLRSLPTLARVLAGGGPEPPFDPVPREAALARMA